MLVLQHAEDCPPARVGDWLEDGGCALDVRRCHLGDPVPADLGEHDGLLVLGGGMGAYDDDRFDWLGPAKQLLAEAIRSDLPTLAVCLGLQLLAVAGGGAVAPASSGPQIGLRPVRLTPPAAEDRLFAPLGATALAVHWNHDVVTRAPDGAVALADSDAGLQAFRLGAHVWAVQFHPEVTLDLLHRWADTDVSAGVLTADQAGARLAAVAAADQGLDRTWRGVTQRFGSVVRLARRPVT